MSPGSARYPVTHRVSFVLGTPVKYVDPDGHSPIPPVPYEKFISQAVDYFSSKGMELVGTLEGAIGKGINTNGADLVFKSGENGVSQVLGVELKNISSNSVNLGTLGKSLSGYGGSIGRLASSANRFLNSSNAQLKEESQTVFDAFKSGNLQNALYTNAQNVSKGAQNVFNNIYTSAQNGTANVVKELTPTVTAVGGAAKSVLQTAGGFLGSCETLFGGIFYYQPSLDPSHTTTS